MDYPYVLGNNKISILVDKIQTAAKPEKVTQNWLKVLGFSSTNDRAFIPLLKSLGFISTDGTPTDKYNLLRDVSISKSILGSGVKELYKDLFSIDSSIHLKPAAEVKGFITRLTGKDSSSVTRMYLTFKSLCDLSDFSESEYSEAPISIPKSEPLSPTVAKKEINNVSAEKTRISANLHYNIQIHLPATTDIAVYNVIFKSIRDNLLQED